MKPLRTEAPHHRRRALGNLAVAALLIALAALSLLWQSESILLRSPDASRLVVALAITIGYLALCALFLRARRRQLRVDPGAPARVDAGETTERMLVVYASQTGYAGQLAAQTAQSLRSGGIQVDLCSMRQLDPGRLERSPRALFVVSTTGEGDAPDMASGFVSAMSESSRRLDGLRYAVLALGDRDYVNFCAFGHAVEGWLQQAGAQALFDTIEVDNGDAGALRLWQYHLGQLSGRSDLPDWQVPEYSRWQLVERRVLNPGSGGDPCFHLALQPIDADLPSWQAGDIAEIGPQQAAADVDAWLAKWHLDGSSGVLIDGKAERLRDVAARSSLDARCDGIDAQGAAERLIRLPHRDYSIASIPADGCIALLLRQWRRADGSLGLGTGWLTEYAEPGAEISVRIRNNTGFHAPADDRPLLLIGNGTGMASLRALLRQRIAGHRYRNWLIFGERNADRDFHYADEIRDWEGRGAIERLDLAFSRDQPERIYVQHRLEARADAVRDWVAQGAAIHVCGSLEGMAPGVDAALRRILGEQQLLELTASSRYRRDVY